MPRIGRYGPKASRRIGRSRVRERDFHGYRQVTARLAFHTLGSADADPAHVANLNRLAWRLNTDLHFNEDALVDETNNVGEEPAVLETARFNEAFPLFDAYDPARFEADEPPRADADGSLVLKNRDIAGRGVRPKAVYQQPAIDGYHGYLTVDTCGTAMLFKGVNDRGLVAANTHIDVERDDAGPAERIRNGTVIRVLLEECATVGEARDRLESYPTDRLAA